MEDLLVFISISLWEGANPTTAVRCGSWEAVGWR